MRLSTRPRSAGARRHRPAPRTKETHLQSERQSSSERTPVASLDHVALEVDDLAESVEWYRTVFGASLVWELSTFHPATLARCPGLTRMGEIDLGGTRLHLLEVRRAEADESSLGRDRSDHFALVVGSVSDLDGYVRRWHRWDGVHRTGRSEPVVVDEPELGLVSVYLRDVDDHEIELRAESGRDV